MGDTERAMKVELWQRENAIEKARLIGAELPGPYECVKCGEPNDRREQGYAVCTDCLGGNQ